ncbi:thioesterase-like superfamily-domain-containing protein [Geopyxis carbonaria]|nr:thioesterase-like superfamily-domain-containing protein [Geopyxis carbonaria]
MSPTAPPPIPVFPPGFVYSSLDDAAMVTPLPRDNDSDGEGQRYEAVLREDWCIGLVPHGGYLTTLLLNASTHAFTAGRFSHLHQPHAIHASLTFLHRCATGPCTLTVSPLKLGRAYTFTTVTLHQSGKPCLTATITHANMASESPGPSLPTAPPPRITPLALCTPQPPDVASAFRIAERNLTFLYPPGSIYGSFAATPSVREQWVSRADGGRMGATALGVLCDMFIPIPENWAECRRVYWYPTLSIALEMKRLPPKEGWKWVGVRVETGMVRGGRMDIDVVMYADAEGEGAQVVALSRHCAVFVGLERNLGGKGGKSGGSGDGKWVVGAEKAEKAGAAKL